MGPLQRLTWRVGSAPAQEGLTRDPDRKNLLNSINTEADMKTGL
jgi:hypothetical protein